WSAAPAGAADQASSSGLCDFRASPSSGLARPPAPRTENPWSGRGLSAAARLFLYECSSRLLLVGNSDWTRSATPRPARGLVAEIAVSTIVVFSYGLHIG